MAIPHFSLDPTEEPMRWRWTPSTRLLTPAATLQGGAGLGAAITALESATGRPAVWATAQYLTYATGPDPIDVTVTVEVTGHNTTQARCVLSRRDTEILTAHGALGARDFEFGGVWAGRPDVPDPDDCPAYQFLARSADHIGDLAEIRLALGRQLDEIETDGGRGGGAFAVWIRCWEGTQPVSVADLAFVGDFMPLGFADAAGRPFAGNSLDNTIRVGDAASTEWMLLSVHVQQVANGFGHGHAELWAEDGTLMGHVSQTVVMRRHSRIGSTGRPAIS
jgi:acyl-CoA thioesterase